MAFLQNPGVSEGAGRAAGSLPETPKPEKGREAGEPAVGQQMAAESQSPLARLERANLRVKLAMARELTASGLSEEAVQRLLHLSAGFAQGLAQPRDAWTQNGQQKEVGADGAE